MKRREMRNCFDRSRCDGGMLVYVYPYDPADIHPTMASLQDSIQKFLQVTDDPDTACVFVVTIDTWDRDPLSVHPSR